MVSSKLNNKSDYAVVCFHGFYGSFMVFGHRLCNGQSDTESRACCPCGILTVKAVEKAVELDIIHVFAAVCDSERRMLLLAQYSLYTAALITVFHCVVKEYGGKLTYLGFVSVISDILIYIGGEGLSVY